MDNDTFTPLVIQLDDRVRGVVETMNCYPDRIELDGVVITDAEVIAFLKYVAGYFDAEYRKQKGE